MGHKAEDFEPLLFFLISSDVKMNWEVRYAFLSWLSVVLLVPFKFDRLDSRVIPEYYQKNYKTKPFKNIELLILDYCKRNMKSPSRIGDGLAECIAVLFRRPDMDDVSLFKEMINWGLNEIATYPENRDVFYATNIYKSLIAMIKNGKRNFIIEIHQEIFEKIVWFYRALQQGLRQSKQALT